MLEIKDILQALCGEAGVAGEEQAVADRAKELLASFCDHLETDAFHNLYGWIGSREPGKKTILLDAHLDEIGLIVTHICDSGFLRAQACGGVDRRGLAAKEVTVLGRNALRGVICTLPPHLSKDGEEKKAMPEDRIYIDIGMNKEQAQAIVEPGDRVLFDSGFCALAGGRVSGRALDDRAGCAAVIAAAARLAETRLSCSVAVCLTAQEETGSAGAAVCAYRVQPDEAIAVDVSYAAIENAPADQCGEMGKGAMIGISPILCREMSDSLKRLANERRIPFQLEIMGGKTGTNADHIARSRGGVRSSLLSIPQKYMHTPCEMVDCADIQSVADLICAYVESFG